jgi:hypothetical protein
VAEVRLVVFACRRVAEAAPDAVVLPCAGRLAAGTLLEAFAAGADGAVVLPCGESRHGCRFEEGAERAERAVLRARRVLGRLGLTAERLAVLRDPAQVGEFRGAIERMGPAGTRGAWRPNGRSGLDRWMSAIAELSAEAALVPRRSDGRPQALSAGGRAELVLWEGCTPFAELLLEEALGGEREGDALRALDAAGLRARVLADERCCGLPLRVAGREEAFRALARRNAERLREAGARRIVTRCAACARVLGEDYAAAGVKLEAEVLPLAAVLADAGWRPAVERAERVADCEPAGERAAVRLLGGLPTAPGGALHAADGWLGGTAQREAVDVVLAGAARRRVETLVASCPRCALALRLLGRSGSWRPAALRVLGLGDLTAGGAEVRR